MNDDARRELDDALARESALRADLRDAAAVTAELIAAAVQAERARIALKLRADSDGYRAASWGANAARADECLRIAAALESNAL